MKYMNWEDLEEDDVLKPTDELCKWMDRHLYLRPEYFVVKSAELDERFQYLKHILITFKIPSDRYLIKPNGEFYDGDFQAFEIVEVNNKNIFNEEYINGK